MPHQIDYLVVIKLLAVDVENEILLVPIADRHADGEIAAVGRAGKIPALEREHAHRQLVIRPEPGPLENASSIGKRIEEILRSKIASAHRAFASLELCTIEHRRVQNVSGRALKLEAAPPVNFVSLRDRRDSQAFVITGRQEETNRVKEMETLTNNDLDGLIRSVRSSEKSPVQPVDALRVEADVIGVLRIH